MILESLTFAAPEALNDADYEFLRRTIYDLSRINLGTDKRALVSARVAKRLRALKLTSYRTYCQRLKTSEGQEELANLVDAISTNHTFFFREPSHFDFLRNTLLPQRQANPLHRTEPLRIWSAACSSGEEPYSLAILLREHVPAVARKDVRILATDISRRMLDKALQAVYPQNAVDEVPSPAYRKYFSALRDDRCGNCQVAAEVRTLVHFAHLNLMGPWPMKGPFQVIFCRNVMIYFDKSTQQELINRFWDYLEPGGYLFVGHSEGLSSVKHRFHYVRPAVYQK
jgi:chemotaxis protein methyltransferase CheR